MLQGARIIKLIEPAFGDFPLSAFTGDRREVLSECDVVSLKVFDVATIVMRSIEHPFASAKQEGPFASRSRSKHTRRSPVAIALADYTSGFGKTYLVEL